MGPNLLRYQLSVIFKIWPRETASTSKNSETQPPGSSWKVLWSFSPGVHTGDPLHTWYWESYVELTLISRNIAYVSPCGPPGENRFWPWQHTSALAFSCFSCLIYSQIVEITRFNRKPSFNQVLLPDFPQNCWEGTDSTQYWKFPTIWNAGGKIILPPTVWTWFYIFSKFHQNISQIDWITASFHFLSSYPPKQVL